MNDFTALGEFTDLHLKVDELSASVVFPGPRPLDEHYWASASTLLALCHEKSNDDFTLSHGGVIWRGRRDRRVVDGLWYRLRRLPLIAPTLDTLPSPFPQRIRDLLLADSLKGGGLIYVCGAAGSGKTTTASATVVSRLRRFGGVAYTIEDPPEMPLNGWHGEGYCAQTEVAGEGVADWIESFRGALRSQPTATTQILFVGEIRNRDSAQIMLRAAANGFLVIATGFGFDVVSGVESLARLAGDDHHMAVGNQLRLVLHQKLTYHRLDIALLVSPDPTHPIAARIRGGHFSHLLSDIHQQELRLLRGESLLETSP